MMNLLQEEELLEAAVININIDDGEYTEEQAKEKFKITNLESASWAFRKIKALNESIAETKKLADIERKRIKEWEDKVTKDDERSVAFFEYLLTEYFLAKKSEDSKFKLSTPYGKISTRKQQPKWNYNEERLVEWLKENNMDLVRVKYEPNKTEIKKTYQVVGNNAVTEDGEIVEGITIEEQPDSITIKVEV